MTDNRFAPPLAAAIPSSLQNLPFPKTTFLVLCVCVLTFFGAFFGWQAFEHSNTIVVVRPVLIGFSFLALPFLIAHLAKVIWHFVDREACDSAFHWSFRVSCWLISAVTLALSTISLAFIVLTMVFGD